MTHNYCCAAIGPFRFQSGLKPQSKLPLSEPYVMHGRYIDLAQISHDMKSGSYC